MNIEEKENLKGLIRKLTEQKEEFQQVSVRGRTIMSRNTARGQYDILVNVISELKLLLPQEYGEEETKEFKVTSSTKKRLINTPISIIYDYDTEGYKILVFPDEKEKTVVIFESNSIIGAWMYQPTMQTTFFKGGAQLIASRAFTELSRHYSNTTVKAMDIRKTIIKMGKWIAENIAYRGKVAGEDD